jgi:hypothetical protein
VQGGVRKANPALVDRPAAADIVDIPHMHHLKVESMVYWTKEQFCLGLPKAAANFTNAVVIVYCAHMLTDAKEARIKDGPTTTPEKFLKAQTWTVFGEAFTTYLETTFGCNRAPLGYIIRDAEIKKYRSM